MLTAGNVPGLRRVARDERARTRDEGRHSQPERLDERRERLVVGDAVDLEMKRPVQLAILLAVVNRDGRAHGLVQRAQLLDLMQRDVLRRERRRIAFQEDAEVQDLLNLASVEERHTRRAVGQAFESPF